MLASVLSLLMAEDDVALGRPGSYSRQLATYEIREPALSPGLGQDLRQALLTGQIRAYFQPKFDLASGAVSGVEVLARWHHPDFGVVSPERFIGALARYGWLDALLFQQFYEGARLQREAREAGHRLSLSFNIMPDQLSQTHFFEQVRAALEACSLAGDSVTFEVLEGTVIQGLDVCLQNCEQLRALGCRLSMDDFGIGFSSLHRLCQLPFDEIKLDREFVQALGQDPRGQAVIISTLALGTALKVPVIIEGVETHPQRLQLLELGAIHAQGYLCGMAMPRQELVGWLAERGEWT